MQSQKLNSFGVLFNASTTWHFDRSHCEPIVGFSNGEELLFKRKKNGEELVTCRNKTKKTNGEELLC